MKLHTDFHDYYDNAVGYGIDEKVHYNRFTKEVEINIKANASFPPNYLPTYLLGFCGKIYPLIKIWESESFSYACDEIYAPKKAKYVYTFEHFEKNKAKFCNWFDSSNYFQINHLLENKRELIRIKQFFIDWHFQSDEVFLENKTPIWVVRLDTYRQKGLINPKLKDYGFNCIKDSFTAFQEISMYLSNILVEQKEVLKIEDKYRIEQHGFDLKTSFRKEKK